MAKQVKEKTSRNEKIIEMYLEGKLTQSKIARIMQISRQRVSKIIIRYKK